MKTVPRFLLALLLLNATSGHARDTYVKPYVRKDGTYVNGYMRTAPNNTVNDNYSTQGNVNPYTGAPGSKPQNPYQQGYRGGGYNSGATTFGSGQ
jgi:hypothetical protein